MMKRQKQRSRPLAYGENSHDFTGARQTTSLDAFYNRATSGRYHNYYREGDEQEDPNDTNTNSLKPDNTTKTLLYVAGGAIVLTGILIWVLGRRKK